jgi:cytochrome c peroxidase
MSSGFGLALGLWLGLALAAGTATGAETRSPATASADRRPAVLAPVFSEDEVARIVSHGPWPVPSSARPLDPSNRFSGNPAAAEFGRLLFFDARLSANGAVSCASCHLPGRGFTDGRARAQGLGLHDRNTQGLYDLAWQRWFGRDGGADSLWAAAVRPMLAAHEMGASPRLLARVVAADPQLDRRYRALFGAPASDERLMVDLAKSLAAYVETLVSPAAPFDAFRDALARGDAKAAARYPIAARRGLKLFIGRGNCAMCHFGPRFTNGEFHDVGIPFVVAPGRVDPGRYAGIRRVRADPYNLTSGFNDQGPVDSAVRDAALKTRTVTLSQRNWGEWKVPSLRMLATSAPYMHDGSKASLRDVVRHYSELDEDRLHADGEAILRPLRLTEGEIDDLVAFLESLGP